MEITEALPLLLIIVSVIIFLYLDNLEYNPPYCGSFT